MRNTCLDAVLGELERWQIAGQPVVANGGKHLKITWTATAGQQRTVIVPSTPSDRRSAANTRAFVRRVLRSDGVELKVSPPRRPRPARPKAIRLELEPALKPLRKSKPKPPATAAAVRTIAQEQLTPAFAAIWAALQYDAPTRLTVLARTLNRSVNATAVQLHAMKTRGLVRNLPDRRGWIRNPLP
jgi:hypothetical protein